MNSSRIYVEAAGGVRLYTISGTTEQTARIVDVAQDTGEQVTKFNAILIDPEGTPEEPKFALRNLYVDTSRIKVIEQGEVYDSQFVTDHTARERFEPALQSV